MAVKNVLAALHPHDVRGLQTLLAYRSGPHGVTLTEVQALARRVGLRYVMARRIGNAPIPLPAIVHWKVHHYAALVGFADGRYHVIDPTFGGDLWITPRALNAETDGYFLVPEEHAPTQRRSGILPVALTARPSARRVPPRAVVLPPGFVPVSWAEARLVYTTWS